jgi:D-alanyl-D-alanine carboxypeptidase
MKRILLIAVIIVVLISSIYIAKHFAVGSFESNLAAAFKIEMDAVKTWQQRGGIHKQLAYGSSDPDVRLLQSALRSETTDKISPKTTGFFGNDTLKAVKDFQKNNNLPETGIVGDQTRALLNTRYFNDLCPTQRPGEYVDYTYRRVDRNTALPQGYIPTDLIDITDQVKSLGIACLKKEAAAALLFMFTDAKLSGINLAVSSSFRREEIQSLLYNFWLQLDYNDNIDKIAPPLHSEHQLGTAVDLTGQSIGNNSVDPNFGYSLEGIWLTNNAFKYGFIQSYPMGKKQLTGYDPEPWHYRYMGVDVAQTIHNQNITLGEYFTQRNQ